MVGPESAVRLALLSFDVEEWFHVLDTDAIPPESYWDRKPSRTPLARMDVRATFLVLGRFARMQPEVVRAIAAAGHKVASHSYRYPLLRHFDPETPRLPLGPRRAFKCYVGLRSSRGKLDALHPRYRPTRYCDWLRAAGFIATSG